MTPLEIELYRRASGDPELATALLDVMARSRSPRSLLAPGFALRLAAGALRRSAGGRRAVMRAAGRDVATAVRDGAERYRAGAPLRSRSASRSSMRRILPVRVFGRSSTNSISRG